MSLAKTVLGKINESKEVSERFHAKDGLLQGFTYEELIDTVYSNEPVKDAKSVQKVFDEILKAQVSEAKSELKSNMKEILKELK